MSENVRAKTMKQLAQEYDNIAAKAIFNSAFDELDKMKVYNYRRLRTCNAYVFETDNFYLLKSYDTFIAAIDKNSYHIADVLRMVYHYTNTSNQHICKFIHDYAPSTHNFYRFTYRCI